MRRQIDALRSGELGTAAQQAADAAVVDRLGRRLGHAVLSILESWPDAERVFDTVVESGAPLGTTRESTPPESDIACAVRHLGELKLKP